MEVPESPEEPGHSVRVSTTCSQKQKPPKILVMTVTRIYKPSPWILWFGVVFFAFPLVFFTLPALWSVVTGVPLRVSSGEDGGPTTPATQGMTLFAIFFPMIHETLGLGLLFTYKNCNIVTDAEGISSRDVRGREKFRAAWADLEQIVGKYESDDSSRRYILLAGPKALPLDVSDRDRIALIQEIRSKAPQVQHNY